MNWQPTMDWHTAKQRADILAKIRSFFNDKGIIEVETPQLCSGTITDVHLDAIEAQYDWSTNGTIALYLQTSPEYAMKRLLADGYQSIYQISKAFRNEAEGRLHNPEFTMLEWYRLGFSMTDLIKEVAELLENILGTVQCEIVTYQQVFITHTGINPLATSTDDCIRFLNEKSRIEPWLLESNCLDTLLQFIFCEFIEGKIGNHTPCFVHSFPANQASLATINSEDTRVANRFECYFKGIELVNGFNELTDASQQISRFSEDNAKRLTNNLPVRDIDSKFIASLESGLPPCSGVALGVDRLVMLALNRTSIDTVISFPTSRA